MIDHIALGLHIQADPNGRGYAVHVVSGATNVIAGLLNEVLTSIIITRSFVGREMFMVATDFNEVKSLGASERDIFGSLINSDRIPGKTVQEVSQFFGPTTTTQASLQSTRTRNGSEVEELFGENVKAIPKDVALALGGP